MTSGLDAITIPKSDLLLKACQRIRRRCFTALFLCATGGKLFLLHCRYVANGSVRLSELDTTGEVIRTPDLRVMSPARWPLRHTDKACLCLCLDASVKQPKCKMPAAGFDPATSLLWADNHPQIGPLRVDGVEDGVKRSSAELRRRVCVLCLTSLSYDEMSCFFKTTEVK